MILDDSTEIPYIHVTHNNLPNDNRFIYVFFFILLYKQNGKSSTAERKNFVVLPVGRELNVTPMSFVVWRFVRTKRERTSAHICEVRRVCSLVKLSPCVCVCVREGEREREQRMLCILFESHRRWCHTACDGIPLTEYRNQLYLYECALARGAVILSLVDCDIRISRLLMY